MPDLKVKTEKGKDGEISCSVEETNRIRAKLGLKPLNVSSKGKRKQEKAEVSTKNGEVSCSIEETNRIRAKLGLKPLNVDSKKKEVTIVQRDERKIQASKIVEERIARARKKRKLKEKLSGVTLGEGEEESASDWITNMKKKQDATLKALQKEKEFEELEKSHSKEFDKKTYDSSQLAGIKLSHNIKNFKAGEEVILTLKDTSILDESNNDLAGQVDELENVNMAEAERSMKRKKMTDRIKRSAQSYAGLEEEYDEDGKPVEKKLLEKYDKEDEIYKHKAAHVLNASGTLSVKVEKKDALSRRTEPEPRVSLLDAVNDNLVDASAEDYLSKDEVKSKVKKEKKKIKKSKKKKDKKKKKRALRETNALADLDEEDTRVTVPAKEKEDTDDEDEPDDMGLQEALLKARKAVRKKEKKIAVKEESETDMDVDAVKNENIYRTDYSSSSVFTNATQFSSAIESRMDDNREKQLAIQRQQSEELKSENDMETDQDNTNGNGGSSSSNAAVSNRDSVSESKQVKTEANEDARKLFKQVGGSNSGLAAALAMFKSVGDIKEAPTGEKKPTTIQKQKKKIDDNTKFDIDLTYRDKNGKILNSKEAYLQMCYRFHGIQPGKNKIEKLKRREEQKKLITQMDSIDTPLGTASALRRTTKKSGQAYITLDDNNKKS